MADFLWGMFGYEPAQTALELRGQLEGIFLVVAFGDLVGVPVLPPLHALRLLPWALPAIETWKRRLAREHGLGDSHDQHLHGV